MATHARIRRQEMLRSLLTRDDVIVGLGRYLLHVVQRHRGNRVEEFHERRVWGRSGARRRRRFFGWRQQRLHFVMARCSAPAMNLSGGRSRSRRRFTGQGDLGSRRRCQRRRPGKIHEVRQRLPGKSFDVIEGSKSEILFGGGVTADAVKAEAGIRNGVRRVVIIDRLRVPDLRPIPTILRPFRVLDHDRPIAHRVRRHELILRGRRRVLFFNDHGAVRDRPRAIGYEPFHDLRRVIDFHCRMDSERKVPDERAGIAQSFVFAPAELPVVAPLKELGELFLKLGETFRQKRARQRQTHARAEIAGRSRRLGPRHQYENDQRRED